MNIPFSAEGTLSSDGFQKRHIANAAEVALKLKVIKKNKTRRIITRLYNSFCGYKRCPVFLYCKIYVFFCTLTPDSFLRKDYFEDVKAYLNPKLPQFLNGQKFKCYQSHKQLNRTISFLIVVLTMTEVSTGTDVGH